MVTSQPVGPHSLMSRCVLSDVFQQSQFVLSVPDKSVL